MNILIPAAGVGKRFAEENYLMPKPLINVLGDPLIAWVIGHLKLSASDRIHIIYTQEMEKYRFQSILRKRFYDLDLDFIPLNYLTRGPAETVLCALNKIDDLEQQILVLDCDTFYEEDIIGRLRNGRNCILYFEDDSNQSLFSYIGIDEHYIVMKIREKERISKFACSGAYAFRDGRILKKYCEMVLNSEHKSKDEYYISNIYDLMLADGETVFPLPAGDFHCLGIPQLLKVFCMNHEALEKKRFCFDLDGTLLSFPKIKGDYSTCQPIVKNVKWLRYLHGQGHTIIIQTSRRMLTAGQNVGRAMALAHKSVFEALEKFDIPFDEILFGKPFAHFYIDDLAVRPWDAEKETGFYNARIEPRHFNQIEYGPDYLLKETSNAGEVYWYQHIPESMKKNFPNVYSIDGLSLKLERIEGIVFSYLLVNNSLTEHNLDVLLSTVKSLHCSEPVVDVGLDYSANYLDKMAERYAAFDYNAISTEAGDYFVKIFTGIENHSPIPGVIHGDLVFSNIFLCDHQLIRFIDMRGWVGNVKTIFGDIFYDYAKIYQSLWGYDFILNDSEINQIYIKVLREYFEKYMTDCYGVGILDSLKYLTAGLFFSLIPLHKDTEKQRKYFELMQELIG